MSNKQKTSQYILFKTDFTHYDGNSFPCGVKFRIVLEDNNFYYIGSNATKIDKNLKNDLYEVGEIVFGG